MLSIYVQILLLCIVVYILFSDYNDKSNELGNLCDNIPEELHQNACTMLGPFIMKHGEKVELTAADLDNALLINGETRRLSLEYRLTLPPTDKENQTTFFSPIREKQRPHLANEKIITEQKRKIHKDIKAYHAFDPFQMNCASSTSSTDNGSPLVKLLQLVQSPQFQGKVRLGDR